MMSKLLFTRCRKGQDFSTVYAKKSHLWSSFMLTCEKFCGSRRANLVDYAIYGSNAQFDTFSTYRNILWVPLVERITCL